MKAIRSNWMPAALMALVVLLCTGQPASAQAPTGPQGGAPPSQQQQTPAQKPATPAQQAPQSNVSISVDVPIVTLDVVATTQHGDILTGLKKENFKVTDDGVPQTITNFAPTDAPITMVLLLEFSNDRWGGFFSYYSKFWSQYLFSSLKQQDWIALETFDMKTRVEVDFTQDKNEVLNGIYHLYFPGFSESNIFDALLETTDRLKEVKGKKSIVVLASGVDTFSKHTLDQTMKALRQSDVTIFCVGLGRVYTNFLDSRGSLGAHMNYLQAENQLKTFSQETGGFAWFPQFEGEMPDVFRNVASFLRHQYSLSFTPSSGARDGKFHKVKVELVEPTGEPLNVTDQKGKKQKLQVYAREGYQATKAGVGD